MKVIPPTTLIGTSLVTSSTVADRDTVVDPAAWINSGGVGYYTEGSQVYYAVSTYVHKIYQCVNSTGTFNSTIAPNLDTTNWLDIGYCNKWKMFDINRSKQTVSSSGTITVVVTPATRINSIALLNLTNINYISITATSSATTIYTNTYSGTKTSYIVFDVPPAKDIVITITISGTGTIGISSCIMGQYEYLGDLETGISLDNLNFSSINRDTYGSTTMTKRRSVPKTNQNLFISSGRVGRALVVRDILNAVPAVWCAMDDNVIPSYYNSLLIVGIYRTFSVSLDTPFTATITLELEEI